MTYLAWHNNFCTTWTLIGWTYRLEQTLAQARQELAKPRSSYMHPIIGVERIASDLCEQGVITRRMAMEIQRKDAQ